jgi:hypothetical protein
MGTYLLEVILFQAVFLAIYLIFLRKEILFQWNRIYLLSTVLLAFALPFIEIPLLQTQVIIPLQIQELSPVIIGATSVESTANVASGNLPISFWWMALYLSGVVFTLVNLLHKYQEINRYFRFKRKGDQGIITIPNSDAAFTFLNTVFLGENIETETRQHILAHEKVHVIERHGIDLFFFETLRVLLWFNPFIYGYQRSISELHEYIADAKAVRHIEHRSYYNQLLNTAFGSQKISFINTFFNQSLIKKRIIMLQKRSKTTAKWKYALLVPVLAGMLTYVGCSSDNNPENGQSQTLEQQISDLQATIDAKGELTEKEVSLLKNLNTSMNENEVIEVVETSNQEEENVALDEAFITDVPYAVVENVPTFAGCEDLADNDAKKRCMSESISLFVQKHFDTSLGKKLGLTGINKIYVQFKINNKGVVEFMGSRGPDPALEKEAERVVNLLPDMTPGKQKGQPVNVLYALPIVLQVSK